MSFQLILLHLCGIAFPLGRETLLIDPPFFGSSKSKAFGVYSCHLYFNLILFGNNIYDMIDKTVFK